MYLDEYYNDNSITYICEKCNHLNSTSKEEQTIFKTLSKDICILNDDEILTCKRCGNIHDSDTPLFKKQSQTQENIPHCPICKSTNIRKISTTNKVGSAVAFGVFSVGHLSKTFKCNNCGMKF